MAGRSPSGWLYVLAVLVMFGGCGVSAWQGYRAFPELESRIAAFPRVPVPGEREVRLEAGEFTLYAENKAPADDSYPDVSSVKCTLTGGRGAIELRRKGFSEQYSVNGFQAQAIARLTVPASAAYQLVCSGGAKDVASVVSVGDISASSLVVDMGTPVIAGWAVGLLMMIVVFVLRRR